MRAARALGLSGRARRAAAGLVLAALLAALAFDGVALWRAQRWNRAIAESAQGGAPAVAAPASAAAEGLPPEVRFALAAAQAARGQDEAALDAWRALQADTPLGRAARFNAANALLRQAEALRAGAQPGQAIALVELAKESYRELLRQDPAFWDARYNLERAQRLQPDADEAEPAPAQAPQDAERAATTMRGVAQGLP